MIDFENKTFPLLDHFTHWLLDGLSIQCSIFYPSVLSAGEDEWGRGDDITHVYPLFLWVLFMSTDPTLILISHSTAFRGLDRDFITSGPICDPFQIKFYLAPAENDTDLIPEPDLDASTVGVPPPHLATRFFRSLSRHLSFSGLGFRKKEIN